MKHFIANFIFKILDAVLPQKKLPGIPIIFYHSIGDGNSKLNVSERLFKEQMQFLSDNGWRAILPKDLKGVSYNDKVFLITFDDGFASVNDIALPILQKYGFVATVFIATDYIGAKSSYARNDEDKNFNMLSKDDIKNLKNHGWCIASHFASHKNLTELQEAEIREEYRKSCESLDMLDVRAEKNIIAYPFNRHNKSVVRVLREMGVVAAFNGGNMLYRKSDNLLIIPRIEANNNFYRFKLNFSPAFHKYARQ